MNILLAPDSFKGSLEAFEVCQAMKNGIQKVLPYANFTFLPLADGGEGTLNIIHDNIENSEMIHCQCHDAYKT